MNFSDLLIAGGVAVAGMKIIEVIITWALGRVGKNKDNQTEKERATNISIKALKDGQKVILLDRILYLGRAYIHENEVDADDRRRLIAMHDVYHQLGGNGDADLIMNAVKALRIK